MVKQFVAVAAAAAAIFVVSPAQAQTSAPAFVGEVRLFPYEKCPSNWIEAEGQVMAISRHAALYRLIGNRFGGDGGTTFNLPDLRDGVPTRGMRYCLALQGVYPRLR